MWIVIARSPNTGWSILWCINSATHSLFSTSWKHLLQRKPSPMGWWMDGSSLQMSHGGPKLSMANNYLVLMIWEKSMLRFNVSIASELPRLCLMVMWLGDHSDLFISPMEYVWVFAMQDCSYRAPPKAMEHKGSRSIHAETSRGYMCRRSNMPQDHFQTCTQ